jgi:uncharacterized protein (DUF305 family)
MTHPEHSSQAASSEHQSAIGTGHYSRLLLMAALSFAAMYGLMYAMVDAWSDVFANLNQAYMAALMTAPMIVLELLLMRGMYRNARWNVAIISASVVAAVICFALIRRQTAIGDRQFLRSMIPHHGAAILMCSEAPIQDAAIKELCRRIIANQRAEIEQMKTLLAR